MGPRIDPTSRKLTGVFLALFVASFTVAAVLGFHVWNSRADIDRLRAELLSEVELQAELFRSQDAKHSVYPHPVREISYVLNPGMKESSWVAAKGRTYPVNQLGLRGQEISPKDEGVFRILLVGDSVFFGWKLREKDKISSRLAHHLARFHEGARIEVLTIALPGWNTRSQRSFLERHLDLLEPDVIVWNVLRNDLYDSDGVVPPGVLSAPHSPQKAAEAPFGVASAFMIELAMPKILERWDANLGAIQSFGSKYGIPVILLWGRPSSRSFFEHVVRRNDLDCPLIVLPASFVEDARWPIGESDPHPTAWATNIIALGILGKLIDGGWVPSLELDDEAIGVLETFRLEESRQLSEEGVSSYLEAKFDAIPEVYAGRGRTGAKSVLYGVEDGSMLKNGTLFLRSKQKPGSFRSRIDVPSAASSYPLKLTLVIRNRLGSQATAEFELVAGTNELEMALPLDGSEEYAYEVSWEFDYSFCRGPSSCYSGRLMRAELLP